MRGAAAATATASPKRSGVRYPSRGGAVTLASGEPQTAHADFFNGWDQARLEHLTTTCLDPRIDCRRAASRR